MADGKHTRTLDVTSGIIWRQLLQLCVPVFLSSIFQQSYSLVDTFCVGQFASPQVLAAVEAPWALCDLVVGFMTGVGAGCAVVVGQLFGAHRMGRVRDGIHTAIGMAFVGGIGFSVLGVIVARPALVAMATPADILPDSVAYTRIYFASLVFSLIYNMGAGLQRAMGDTRTPSVVVAATSVLNMVLDVLFVAVLRMGAIGAGLATSLSVASGAAVTLWTLAHAGEEWELDLRQVRIERGLSGEMIRCGLPLGLQNSCYGISNMTVQAAVNSFGSTAVAAWGLSGRIDAVVWLVSDALATSVTTFSAQNFGAGNTGRMRRGLRTSMGLTCVLVGATAGVVLLLRAPLAAIFVTDANICKLTAYMLGCIAPFYLVYSLMDNVAGSIRGTGDSVGPMAIAIVGTCLLRVVWVLAVVPRVPTIAVVLASYPVTWAVSAAMMVVYYLRGRRQARW